MFILNLSSDKLPPVSLKTKSIELKLYGESYIHTYSQTLSLLSSPDPLI